MDETEGQPEYAPVPGEKRRLVTNTLANGFSQVAAMLASFVFMPLLIGSFGLDRYGLYMLASSVTAYAVLLDFGVGSALTKMVAEHHAKGNRGELAGSISSALLFYTIVGGVVALAMVVVGFFAQQLFQVSDEGARLLRDMLWVGAVFQLWYWPAATARHVLAGLQRFDVLSTVGVAATVLGIGATAWVLYSGSGPIVLVFLTGMVTALVGAVNIVLARRLLGMPVMSYRAASRLYLAAIFAFSWTVFVLDLSDVLFYQQTDRVILGIFAGAAAVGLYEAAAKFNALVSFMSGLAVSAVLPLASSLGAEGRHASLKSLLLRGTKYIAALIAPVALVLSVLATPIIANWLGPRFNGQGRVAAVLVLPHALVCLGVMGDAIVMSKGRLAGRIPYVVAQAVLNVVLSVALVGRLGVMGVALGTAIAHLIDFPLHMQWLLKETGTHLGEWTRSVVAPVYPLLLVPVAIAFGLSRTPLVDTIFGDAVIAAVAITCYWVLLYVVGFNQGEKDQLRAFLTAARGRILRSPAQ